MAAHVLGLDQGIKCGHDNKLLDLEPVLHSELEQEDQHRAQRTCTKDSTKLTVLRESGAGRRCGGVSGLYLSLRLDTAAGPSIVLALAALFFS